MLLSAGVAAFLVITAVTGTRLVRRMLPPRHCCAPVPEVNANLKALYTSQRAYWQEKDTYSEDMSRVGFAPEPGNRYTYFAAPRGRVSFQLVAADSKGRDFRGSYKTFEETGCPLTLATLPDGTRAGLGVTRMPGGDSTASVFIGAAVANIDDDPTPDCWSIATVARVAADGSRIAPGEPYNELNDMDR